MIYKAVRYNGRTWTDPMFHADALRAMRDELFPRLTIPERLDKQDTLSIEFGYEDEHGNFTPLSGHY